MGPSLGVAEDDLVRLRPLLLASEGNVPLVPSGVRDDQRRGEIVEPEDVERYGEGGRLGLAGLQERDLHHPVLSDPVAARAVLSLHGTVTAGEAVAETVEKQLPLILYPYRPNGRLSQAKVLVSNARWRRSTTLPKSHCRSPHLRTKQGRVAGI